MIASAYSPAIAQKRRDSTEVVPVVLIHEIANGSNEALSQLFKLTRPIIYGLVYRTLRNHAAAEETVVDVYLQIWKQAPGYSEERGGPLVWLITIARSRALDRLRHENRLKNRGEPLADLPTPSAEMPSPELNILLSERCTQVQVALTQLTPAQREALTLAFYFGMTQTEIALYLGQPLGTIKTRIRYGLLHLKRLLVGEAAY